MHGQVVRSASCVNHLMIDIYIVISMIIITNLEIRP